MAPQVSQMLIPPQHIVGSDAHEVLHAQLERVFDLREHGPHDRHEVEHFIRDCFMAAHGARIARFMPRLLSLQAQDGNRIAAFGLRRAVDAPLFLENYFNRPVETMLAERLGHPVYRKGIVEVGNLSALYPGAARWLIVALTSMLRNEGYRWVVFTGTTTLRNGFHRLGLRPVELGVATLAALPANERANWGSYYDHAPRVLAGDITYGYQSLLMQRDLSAVLRANIAAVERGQSA